MEAQQGRGPFDLVHPAAEAEAAPSGPPPAPGEAFASSSPPPPLGPLSALAAAPPGAPLPEPPPVTGHRASCHRCGNMRKSTIGCRRCPATWCARCAERLIMEYGEDCLTSTCPLCANLCCCQEDRASRSCNRIYHCYKKCA